MIQDNGNVALFRYQTMLNGDSIAKWLFVLQSMMFDHVGSIIILPVHEGWYERIVNTFMINRIMVARNKLYIALSVSFLAGFTLDYASSTESQQIKRPLVAAAE